MAENLSWFSEHLEAIRTHVHAPKVALRIHATRSTPSDKQAVSEKPSTQSLQPTVASMSSTDLSPMTPVSEQDDISHILSPIDPEKEEIAAVICHINLQSATTSSTSIPIEHGRPDLQSLIREAVQSVDKSKRVLVAACGPDSLMRVVRNTTASLITSGGPSIELHCEQFGW